MTIEPEAAPPAATPFGPVVSAGYHVVCRGEAAETSVHRPLSAGTVTASSCLVDICASISWAHDTEETLTTCGVAPERLRDAMRWLDEHADACGHPDVFFSVDTARSFVERFLVGSDVSVIGVGLLAEAVDGFIADHDRLIQQPDGIRSLTVRRESLAGGGVPLGWEPLCVDFGGIGCSWRCNDLPELVAAEEPLALNPAGLLADRAAALAVMERIDPLPKEPGLWQAFLLVAYPVG